jgi:hypothetical protein
MIAWGMVAGLALTVGITATLWRLALRAHRHPIDECL